MTVRSLLHMGDPRLLRHAEPVTDFDDPDLRALIADMEDTMRAANGAGIAAPQIGVNRRVVIFGTGEPVARYPDAPPIARTVLINPVIDILDAQIQEDWEGCLSVPGLRGWVPRATRIRYRGQDATGAAIDRTVEGFHARVVQHECDHLDGVLYPMRMRDFTRFGFTDVLFPDIAHADD